jgi:hypothetical protein
MRNGPLACGLRNAKWAVDLRSGPVVVVVGGLIAKAPTSGEERRTRTRQCLAHWLPLVWHYALRGDGDQHLSLVIIFCGDVLAFFSIFPQPTRLGVLAPVWCWRASRKGPAERRGDPQLRFKPDLRPGPSTSISSDSVAGRASHRYCLHQSWYPLC